MIYLNFFIPLLFLLSIGFLIHAIYLFLKSKSLRNKAIRRALLPLVYIVGTVSFLIYRKAQIRKEAESELVGSYTYAHRKNDEPILFFDAPLSVELSQDKKFQYLDPSIEDSLRTGTWEVYVDRHQIRFYGAGKKLFRIAQLRRSRSRLVLFFNDSTIFIKNK